MRATREPVTPGFRNPMQGNPKGIVSFGPSARSRSAARAGTRSARQSTLI